MNHDAILTGKAITYKISHHQQRDCWKLPGPEWREGQSVAGAQVQRTGNIPGVPKQLDANEGGEIRRMAVVDEQSKEPCTLALRGTAWAGIAEPPPLEEGPSLRGWQMPLSLRAVRTCWRRQTV